LRGPNAAPLRGHEMGDPMNDAIGTSGARRLAVYAIPESKDGERRFWPKIGIAFTNQDGSITLLLEALPLGTNRLQVREMKLPGEGRPAVNGAPRNDFETMEVRP
jgi:hypothetical protein